MLNTDQIDQLVFRMNMLDTLRTPVLRGGDERGVVELPRLLPIAADFRNDINWNRIQSVPTFVQYLPDGEAPSLVHWSSTFGDYRTHNANMISIQPSSAPEYFAHEGNFTLIQLRTLAAPVDYFPHGKEKLIPLDPTFRWSISSGGEVARPNPRFDCCCDLIASTGRVLKAYVSESERKVRESWKRLCRRNILSSGVSKNGHLAFLVPSYRRVCVETAARDQVIHLEVIALAKEQEAPDASAVGQMLISSGESWKRWRSRLSNLLSRFLRRMLPSGFMACGVSFASAERLSQY
jgi:hypothetical protein